MQKKYRYLAMMAVALAALGGCERQDDTKSYEDGKAAFEAHDLKLAAQCLEKSLAGNPTNVDAIVYMARTMLDFGELVSARSWIGKAQELAGGDADVRLLAAQIAWHVKDWDAATKGFMSLANDTKLPVSLRAEGWTGVGIVEMTASHRDEARVAFLRAIKLDRRHAAARYHLGHLYRESFGYANAALEQFDIFVRLDSNISQRVQKVLRSKIPELKATLSRASADRPGGSKRDSTACAALIAKADMAWGKGNYKTARLNYQEALRQDPLSYPAAMGIAKSWLKTDSSRRGLTNALDAYKQACLSSPGSVTTYLATADLAARLGQYAQAVDFYSRAVAADPNSLGALDGLIRSLRRVGGRNSAAQAYQGYRDLVASSKKK